MKKVSILSLYEWLVASLVFWVLLACGEVVGAIFVKSLPPPLGSGTMPKAIDLRYLIAALSIYAILSIPAALTLWGSETALSWLKKKTGFSFLNINRMDLFLLFGFGLLGFKWISNLMAYLVKGDHLPFYPYLLLAPLLVVHEGITSFFKRTPQYYLVHWVCIVLGAIFLSKTAYDVFIRSSLSIMAKWGLFVFCALGVFTLSVTMYSLLYLLLSRGFPPNFASVLLFVIPREEWNYLPMTEINSGPWGISKKGEHSLYRRRLLNDFCRYYRGREVGTESSP